MSVRTAPVDRGGIAAGRRSDRRALPPPQLFDRLARLAGEVIEAPIALVCLVHTDRQFFLGAHGLPDHLGVSRETTLEYSICQHTVATRRPLIVADTRNHPALVANRAVRDLGVTAYAGIPLVAADCPVVGAMCVMDYVIRDWTDDQLAFLAHLADITIEEL
ncbi:MAG TPA: GAF domain-containing protein [Acidimicrobiales bacterium]|jgi:GAF domain-containing protein